MPKRTETKKVMVGNVQIGGQNRVVMQSMTNTKTKDVEKTISQIRSLQTAGCDIVRLAVLDEEDAYAIGKIKEQVNCPLVADIHFNYRLALIAAEQGIDKLRINPGNIGERSRVVEVIKACQARKIPIRIGVNSGSLGKEILERFGGPTAEAMVESARYQVQIMEEEGFDDLVLSFKSSDVPLTIDAYRLAAQTFRYPLHLGVTEAGTMLYSSIKSSAALGALLHEGIGDTIRISVSSDPVDELAICKTLLKSFNLLEDVPDLISCPTCGRLQYDMLPLAKEIENFLKDKKTDISVAIMGCAVNGPQEASRADIGIAGGKDSALLFRKGKIIRKIPQADIEAVLKAEILRYMEGTGDET
ncbi:MAG: flavodoxin-dependent (E)-4-hydroxy-3-methylbut-2-enyl-diphosphate synthase [Clostridia bacterium]|nr:flavodoxin-dependent (E)-4-hydroxy-3-methylbut-2-enyl-diphosphate synthase [Clostridia bacterium]NLF21211.1 flavodoxin-dependent (E)-4-hydroxy-3-methylbut-2-enyl-diphosphate synthase [Clostridiaceae bacterium]